MLAAAVIAFREVLEAALVVGIITAAAHGVAGRNFWVFSGIGAGLIGSAMVAAFAAEIGTMAGGVGQEVMNAGILLLAVMMLGWHSIWMSRHGRELAKQMGDVGRAVLAGSRPLYVIAIAIGTAVLREGSETVLFLSGLLAGEESPVALLIGGLAGAAAGVGVGVLLYRGLLRIPLRHFFTVTNWMILLLCAGMAAQAAGFLVQADLLPPLISPAWDTSALLDQGSLLGKVLHGLIGYESRPDGIQVLFYLGVLITVGLLTFAVHPEPSKGAARPAVRG